MTIVTAVNILLLINHTTIPMEMIRVPIGLNQLKDTDILIYQLSTNQLLPATSVESYGTLC